MAMVLTRNPLLLHDSNLALCMRMYTTWSRQQPRSVTFGIIDQMKQAGVTAEEVANSRLVMINSWRNVSKHPLTRFPLGVCDARSVGPEELCRSSVGGKGGSMGGDASLEFYSSLFSRRHQWYWYPEMLNTEVLLFKTYDSEARPFQPTLHSAFDDEHTHADAPERQSCEARILCLLPRSAKL